mgnify:CR=1 FL=1
MMVEARNTTTIIHQYKKINKNISDVVKEYEGEFGIGPVWIIRIPARLCLAADHTDYWIGFTPELITMASDSQEMLCVIGARDDGIVSCVSSDEKFESWNKEIDEVDFGDGGWLDWLGSFDTPKQHWSNYVMGSVLYTQMHKKIKLGFNMYISSTIPPAAGASSSSALATSAMFAIKLANNLSVELNKTVKEVSEGEWFCGTRGGMMDHATMLYAEKGGVLRLTFNPFTTENIELPIAMKKCKFTTLFTHPSEKGGKVRRAFNELSLVAREIVPRLLNGNWFDEWDEYEKSLPEILTINQICEKWPDEKTRWGDIYPDLFTGENLEIKISTRFRFAMRELERSREMQNMLKKPRCDPKVIGNIMNEAWVDSGELYGIRTPIMDELAERIRKINGVLGIKVMGAGFGGNLLILTEKDVDLELAGFERISECSPGSAASFIDMEETLPKLDNCPPVAAVLLCGGKGTRMLNEGITTHKPLLELNGVPSTRLVIEKLKESDMDFSQIIVVVPPEMEDMYLIALRDLNVKVVIQKDALGTGNAVYCAIEELLSPIKHVFVSFGTQPLIRTVTIESSLSHHLKSGAGFTLPTTLRNNPYAPLIRNERGVVIGSLETHLDSLETPDFGETNVGGYWASKEALYRVLNKLHDDLFDSENTTYNTISGELGFPNEMTRGCIEEGLGVEGIAIADPEEVIGLKTPENIKVIESWLDKRNR